MKKIFLKSFLSLLSVLVAAGSAAGLAACAGASQEGAEKEPVSETVLNGGFETADLTGWTVESGEAYDEDSVSSRKSFTAEGREVPVNHTGNWYLDGKGFDRTRSNGYTGSLRSKSFVLSGSGEISMKLAGGATFVSDGGVTSAKSREKLCYVGVYTEKDDQLIAKFTNKNFSTRNDKTDQFIRYKQDLSGYLGETLYLRIVDNDTSFYYGYLSVDDICAGGQDPQKAGQYFVKSRKYLSDVAAPSVYEIKNGGFETGSLAGWTILEGEAFSHDGVNRNAYWWNENIPYVRDGSFHYGHFAPAATGRMRSSEFVLGGSGYISYKLGGCADNALTYLRFMVKGEDGGEDTEVARFSNFKYWNYQFPYVQNGMRLLNLVQYYADFSAYLGKTMYIEAVDLNSSSDELGCMTLDSVQTYWKEKPEWYTGISFEAKLS